MSPKFDLDRFVDAQRNSYENALAELKDGAKRTHWMWFIFPQIAGLGHSPMAQRYAIGSIEEARAYMAHPVLGDRLRECIAALEGVSGKTAEQILGSIDAVKLRSSLTLFSKATQDPVFGMALGRWFKGQEDQATIKMIGPG